MMLPLASTMDVVRLVPDTHPGFIIPIGSADAISLKASLSYHSMVCRTSPRGIAMSLRDVCVSQFGMSLP